MALTVKGIISFPTLFTPKTAKGAEQPKYSVTILLPPADPQVAMIQQEVEQAKLNGCPNGYTGKDECFGAYDTKYAGKDYYDPRFTGWWVLSCSAKADDKPAVVDSNHQPVVDPGLVYSGMVAYVNLGVSYYNKGKTGIGGWLNGVMITDEEPTMGRLDNKPSVEQMFASVGAPSAIPSGTPAVTTTNVPPAPVPQAPVQLIMTAAANGMTYDQYKTAGWTDDQMIANGVAQAPSFA